MELQDAAWARFVQTGQVSDYLQYCSVRGTAAGVAMSSGGQMNAASAPGDTSPGVAKRRKRNASGHKRSGFTGAGRS
ncbi:MAG: hypothetical protein LBJ12_08625 [Oscillospiraceae bacterium]|nr:hypothetical protein [Oscillospiraceae bacterium]